MPDITINDQYEALAKLLYPSIEASGNVYYGQTRKLTMDEILGKNKLQFESHVESFNENGQYKSYFCWKIGPLKGSVLVEREATVTTFPGINNIYVVSGTGDSRRDKKSLDSNFILEGTSFVKYKLTIENKNVNNTTYAGDFTTYQKELSLELKDVYVVTDENGPIEEAVPGSTEFDFIVTAENNENVIYIKVLEGHVLNIVKNNSEENTEENTEENIVNNTNYTELPLTFTAHDGSVTLYIQKYGNIYDSYYYKKSTDLEWNDYTFDEVDPLKGADISLNSGESVSFKINDNFTCRNSNDYITFSTTNESAGKLSLSGNINSIISNDYVNLTVLDTIDNVDCFYQLFKDNITIYSAENLILNATTLANDCYKYMFSGCESLVSPPELPATTLAEWCYANMFEDCTSLIKVPELHATTLAEACYCFMFSGCDSLIKAPDLPATTLQYRCYEGMFLLCSQLTYAPELPATELAEGCYSRMFERCTNLSNIYCYAMNNISSDTCSGWLEDTSINGTLYKNPNVDDNTWESLLPATWNIEVPYRYMPLTIKAEDGPINVAIEPQGSLSSASYKYKLHNSSDTADYTYEDSDNYSDEIELAEGQSVSLWSADNVVQDTTDYITISITRSESSNGKAVAFGNPLSIIQSSNYTINTLNDSTLYSLFVDQELLSDASNLILSATTLADSCYKYMFGECENLTSAPELPATTLTEECYSRMFERCTSLQTAPELPTTILADSCYNFMFLLCSQLTYAPELPATTLIEYCYYGMFQGCTSLASAPELQATVLADGCYESMFYGCKSLVSAPELPATQLADSCYENMFYGCESLVSPPELPATTLADSCYMYMFQDCNSLASAPELPATTLADDCYAYMFSGCTSLQNATILPAATLADSCYDSMFQDCTGLTSDIICNAQYNIANGLYDAQWLPEILSSDNKLKLYIFTDESKFNDYVPTDTCSLERISPQFTCKMSLPEESSNLHYSDGIVVSSGSDSNENGRGKLNNDTLFNMEAAFNPGNSHQMNDYNNDGSFNQDIWGYKCFNSPVQFRNGIYGECSALTTFKNSDAEADIMPSNTAIVTGSSLFAYNTTGFTTSRVYIGYTDVDTDNKQYAVVGAECDNLIIKSKNGVFVELGDPNEQSAYIYAKSKTETTPSSITFDADKFTIETKDCNIADIVKITTNTEQESNVKITSNNLILQCGNGDSFFKSTFDLDGAAMLLCNSSTTFEALSHPNYIGDILTGDDYYSNFKILKDNINSDSTYIVYYDCHIISTNPDSKTTGFLIANLQSNNVLYCGYDNAFTNSGGDNIDDIAIIYYNNNNIIYILTKEASYDYSTNIIAIRKFDPQNNTWEDITNIDVGPNSQLNLVANFKVFISQYGFIFLSSINAGGYGRLYYIDYECNCNSHLTCNTINDDTDISIFRMVKDIIQVNKTTAVVYCKDNYNRNRAIIIRYEDNKWTYHKHGNGYEECTLSYEDIKMIADPYDITNFVRVNTIIQAVTPDQQAPDAVANLKTTFTLCNGIYSVYNNNAIAHLSLLVQPFNDNMIKITDY